MVDCTIKQNVKYPNHYSGERRFSTSPLCCKTSLPSTENNHQNLRHRHEFTCITRAFADNLSKRHVSLPGAAVVVAAVTSATAEAAPQSMHVPRLTDGQ